MATGGLMSTGATVKLWICAFAGAAHTAVMLTRCHYSPQKLQKGGGSFTNLDRG